mmetsp:Transcript_51830/g.160769  ORF Transcript_51830/g.160769 Transcript_51830/m.160769 type:complete len:284 (+) Transcript_51830:445-1296(+)
MPQRPRLGGLLARFGLVGVLVATLLQPQTLVEHGLCQEGLLGKDQLEARLACPLGVLLPVLAHGHQHLLDVVGLVQEHEEVTGRGEVEEDDALGVREARSLRALRVDKDVEDEVEEGQGERDQQNPKEGILQRAEVVKVHQDAPSQQKVERALVQYQPSSYDQGHDHCHQREASHARLAPLAEVRRRPADLVGVARHEVLPLRSADEEDLEADQRQRGVLPGHEHAGADQQRPRASALLPLEDANAGGGGGGAGLDLLTFGRRSAGRKGPVVFCWSWAGERHR